MACKPRDKEYDSRALEIRLLAVRERQRKYRETHREQIQQHLSKWRAEHKGYFQEWRQRKKQK